MNYWRAQLQMVVQALFARKGAWVPNHVDRSNLNNSEPDPHSLPKRQKFENCLVSVLMVGAHLLKEAVRINIALFVFAPVSC